MDLKITFLGAAQNVTGSRYLLDADGRRILVDCGMYQERELTARNWDPFPVPPASVDAVLLTHAHIDHSGYLPRFHADGFSGPVHCTAATAEIADIVLLDSGRLQEEDAEMKRKRHAKEGRQGRFPPKPLYTEEDAQRCRKLFSPVRYGENVALGRGISASFHDAGHILGSAMIMLRISGPSSSKSILFSGDIGRPGRPILKDPTPFEQADLVVTESTYGDRLHKDDGDVAEKLVEAVQFVRQGGGNLVIPSFAVERAHELLYHFNSLVMAGRIPNTAVCLDSPMAVRVTQVFMKHYDLYDEEMTGLVERGKSPFRFKGLEMITSVDQSKALNDRKGTAVIIAGSGMCTGGRIKHHLVHNISRSESMILFPGFQANGTLGRLIVEGARHVRILGRDHPVKATVSRIQGFSGHADRDELYGWISKIKTRPLRIFVTHGEPEAASSYAGLLRAGLGCEVVVPSYGTEAAVSV